MTLSSRIKALRNAKSLSIRGLAKLAGCSHTHISDIENDQKKPSLNLLGMLAIPLSTTLSYLQYGEDADKICIARLKEVVEKSGDRDALFALQRMIDNLLASHSFEQSQRLKAKEEVLKVYEYHAQKGKVPDAVKNSLSIIQNEIDQAGRYIKDLFGGRPPIQMHRR